MRLILVTVLLLPMGCDHAADARYIAQFREDGIRACIRGESVMRPHWGVPPDRLELTCNCIVDAYMEGKTRRQLQYPTIEDQMRARERCSGGAPEGAGPGDVMNLEAAVMTPLEEGNAAGSKE
jgi:hypothetical protein